MGPQPSQAQTTWTVCPQGPPWCHFSSIQRAVDVASPGDTVFIRAGTYMESLLIRKDLTLIGEDPSRVLIRGGKLGWPVITVSTLEPEDIFAALLGLKDLPSITVTLRNLQVLGSSRFSPGEECADWDWFVCPAGVMVKGPGHVRLENLWVHDNAGDGVSIGLLAGASVEGSYVFRNEGAGVHAWLGVKVKIQGNTISENGGSGVLLESAYRYYGWLTVKMPVEAQVVSNWILNNRGYGIEAQTGKEVVSCYGNVIQGNGKGPLSPGAWERCH